MADVIRRYERVSEDVIKAFHDIAAATAYESNGQSGMLDPRIHAVHKAAKVCGPALTVKCRAGDNLMIHKAVTIARPGDVLVVNIGNDTECGAWGEILTTAALAAGIAGLVIDGAVRDVEAIERRGFAVFARGIAVGATTKRSIGAVNHSVVCGNVLVRPGDLVIGDLDGIVVIARERCAEVLRTARAREEREAEMMKRLASGATTLELLKLDEVIRGLGMEEEPA